MSRPTLAVLIARYRREWVNGCDPRSGKPRLRPSSRAVYETNLQRIHARSRGEFLHNITAQWITTLRDEQLPLIGYVPTYHLLRHMRNLLSFAERVGMIPRGSNPAARFDLEAPPPRWQIWESADEEAFNASAKSLGFPSLTIALELAIYSAQRSGDLIAMTSDQLKPVTVEHPDVRRFFADPAGRVMGWHLSQGKTRDEHAGTEVRLEIAFEPDLLARIEAAIKANQARAGNVLPIGGTPVLSNDRTGKAWTLSQFQEAWRTVLNHAAKAAGRPAMRDLVWHDLRRTRVVRLRRLGLDAGAIATITGHSPSAIWSMLKVYGPTDPQMTAAALARAIQLERLSDTA
jgi:hypothetical protein